MCKTKKQKKKYASKIKVTAFQNLIAEDAQSTFLRFIRNQLPVFSWSVMGENYARGRVPAGRGHRAAWQPSWPRCVQHVRVCLSVPLVFFCMFSALERHGKNNSVLSGKGTRIPGRVCFCLYSRVVSLWYGYKLEAFTVPKGIVINGHGRKYSVRKIKLKAESSFD